MTDEEKKQQEESAERQKEQMRVAGRSLAAQGFNKEQIAAQLSSKYQITIAEAAAVLDQDDEKKKN